MRVLYVERAGHWWWNAWNPACAVERSGCAETREQAHAALAAAVDAS